MRTYFGRPSSNMRLSTWTATSISVARRSSVCERNPSPITRFHLPIAVSARARFVYPEACCHALRPRSAISWRWRSRCVGSLAAVWLGTAVARGGTMTAAFADQLESLASGIVDGRDHRLSIVVEERNDLFRSCRVGDAREVTKIAEPDDGPDAVGHAPGDAAFQNALAGIPAEVGLDQGCRDAGERCTLHRKRQGRREAAQRLDLVLGEPV